MPAVPGPVRFMVWNLSEKGGSLRSNLQLAEHLSRHHPVEVVSLLRTAEQPFYPLPPGVTARVLDDRRPSARGGLLQRCASRLPSLLLHPDDRAITSYSLWTDLQLLRTLRATHGGCLITTRPALHLFAARFVPPGVVVVAREHDNFTQRTPAIRNGLRHQSGGLDAVSTLSQGDLRDYDELLGDLGVYVFQQPNALQALPGELAPVRNKVVLAAGRLRPQKGFDLLIRAFAPVVASHPDWSLHIYGDGPMRPELQQQIDDLQLTDHVSLLPTTPELGVQMGRAGMFVLSSRYEGFGRVLLEALSKALPVVSFDCPRGPAEILTHGQDGLLVPAEDVAGLSQAILRLIEDPQLRSRLGGAGPARAAAYDIRTVGARWQQELGHLTGARLADTGDSTRR
jgi:glycosyltransferase involved in cell wall biosynthesis